jgi:hypothetical protein
MAVEVYRDLRNLFGPARDQGARPTCLAFAASDAHAALRAGWEPLSCEFAFYHAQRRVNRSPAEGTTLPAILEALPPCQLIYRRGGHLREWASCSIAPVAPDGAQSKRSWRGLTVAGR